MAALYELHLALGAAAINRAAHEGTGGCTADSGASSTPRDVANISRSSDAQRSQMTVRCGRGWSPVRRPRRDLSRSLGVTRRSALRRSGLRRRSTAESVAHRVPNTKAAKSRFVSDSQIEVCWLTEVLDRGGQTKGPRQLRAHRAARAARGRR